MWAYLHILKWLRHLQHCNLLLFVCLFVECDSSPAKSINLQESLEHSMNPVLQKVRYQCLDKGEAPESMHDGIHYLKGPSHHWVLSWIDSRKSSIGGYVQSLMLFSHIFLGLPRPFIVVCNNVLEMVLCLDTYYSYPENFPFCILCRTGCSGLLCHWWSATHIYSWSFSHLFWSSPCAGPASISAIQYFRSCAMFSVSWCFFMSPCMLSLHLFFGRPPRYLLMVYFAHTLICECNTLILFSERSVPLYLTSQSIPVMICMF